MYTCQCAQFCKLTKNLNWIFEKYLFTFYYYKSYFQLYAFFGEKRLKQWGVEQTSVWKWGLEVSSFTVRGHRTFNIEHCFITTWLIVTSVWPVNKKAVYYPYFIIFTTVKWLPQTDRIILKVKKLRSHCQK